ncbi:hypothetical protein [Ureibacillus thermophilus]|uniref:DUF2680 domain-containing protein n=1 Tax=Ureibacillus thermophilus TaxID=367743 RepID=A0A4P6UUC5_9BACL|nr:hypothetical protein [Ureibacillus thermophilus]QBK26155.1 hypothetical protein DKZ56_09910 [Ureibacillus thermophilus]
MKKWFPLFSFLLTLCILLAPSDTSAHSHTTFIKQYEQLNDEQKQQVDRILNHLHEEFEKLGVKADHPNVHEIYSKLDENTKEQVRTIIKELDEGKISSKEADQKLAELGVIPIDEKCKIFENLDEETKQKAKEIIKEMKSGAIARNKAEDQLKELGVELPKKPELDEQTREKVNQLLEEVEKEFEKLGLEFPKHHYQHFIK